MTVEKQIQTFLKSKKIDKKICCTNYTPLQIFYQFEEIANKYIQTANEQIKEYEKKTSKTKKEDDNDEKYCKIDKMPARDALRLLEESGSDDEDLYSDGEILTSEKDEESMQE